eukprot:CAMPEP_0117764664 /NCGR_PEP_ID=MMETSP0947-20121206/19548_1 /TAXON_ID=44440 /ORGANISM="Chattonella subsalsa, Strain CCMP2191" /LENGTH=38 /DNA_ID= /DNA_START= /DNA_END= /DNA_ORIENTATION=
MSTTGTIPSSSSSTTTTFFTFPSVLLFLSLAGVARFMA